MSGGVRALSRLAGMNTYRPLQIVEDAVGEHLFYALHHRKTQHPVLLPALPGVTAELYTETGAFVCIPMGAAGHGFKGGIYSRVTLGESVPLPLLMPMRAVMYRQ